jgi:hypothetical protein
MLEFMSIFKDPIESLPVRYEFLDAHHMEAIPQICEVLSTLSIPKGLLLFALGLTLESFRSIRKV